MLKTIFSFQGKAPRLTFNNKKIVKRQVINGAAITLFSLITIGYWFIKSYDANASGFDHSVSVALMSVADTMSEKASVQKRSSNLFYVTTNSPLSNEVVDTLINKAFSTRDIRLNYELCIYNAQDDSLIYENRAGPDKVLAKPEECLAMDGINKNFAVAFPSKKTYVLGKSDAWIMITFLAVIISWFFYYLKTTLNTPYALPNQGRIRIGNSCLDHRNQHLKVNKEVYQLTHKENQVLKLLFENPNQVINRDEFLESIWKKDGFFVARSMDVFISKVRKYLKDDKSIKIENLRSIGYRLNVFK